MGKPRDGKEVKKQVSVRVEPSKYLQIVKEYGSFSAFVNAAIKKDKKLRG